MQKSSKKYGEEYNYNQTNGDEGWRNPSDGFDLFTTIRSVDPVVPPIQSHAQKIHLQPHIGVQLGAVKYDHIEQDAHDGYGKIPYAVPGSQPYADESRNNA